MEKLEKILLKIQKQNQNQYITKENFRHQIGDLKKAIKNHTFRVAIIRKTNNGIHIRCFDSKKQLRLNFVLNCLLVQKPTDADIRFPFGNMDMIQDMLYNLSFLLFSEKERKKINIKYNII
jgi:hypothetical protein